MLKHFGLGFKLMVSPKKGWDEIGNLPYSPWLLAGFTLILSMGVFVSRSVGSAWMGMKFPWFLLEGLLFTLICIGVSLSIGLVLIPCARFARRPVGDSHAMKLALFSSMPLWVTGVLQVIPNNLVRAMVLLLSLGHCSYLLFRGLPVIFGTEPIHTLWLALLASFVWVIGMSIMTQVFLGVAFVL